MQVVFFGSGPVAAESLRLLQEHFSIEAVVTKPTTIGQMQATCPNAPIYTVSDKAELDDLFTTTNFTSQVGILIDFGIIVSKKIIEYFQKGIINSHFSLLPELRGADPLSFAILEGKQQTGISLMLLVEAMDEGPLLHQSKHMLEPNETTPTLTGRLILQSVSDLVSTVPKWTNNLLEPYAQDKQSVTPTYTRKLTKDDSVLDFRKPAEVLEREIRAFVEWPKSRTTIGSVECVITQAMVIQGAGTPGTLLVDKNSLSIYTADKALRIVKIKPAGKREMEIAGFLNGYGSRIVS